MHSHGFLAHDHAACIAEGVAAADRHCRANGLRLTPVRRRVLEILLAEHRALGAYDVLEILRAEGLGAQPPVAYRALDFLVTHGFVHRIEGRNAFVACTRPESAHSPAFLICDGCKLVAELDADRVRSTLGAAAAAVGFSLDRAVVEAQGLCPDCRAAAGA